MATILIVDDEPILRQLFQKVIEHDGHTVMTASNGREALEVMREQVPDLIMLDMQMPAMDGTTFLRLIRRHQDWAHVPVVIMSAMAIKVISRMSGCWACETMFSRRASRYRCCESGSRNT